MLKNILYIRYIFYSNNIILFMYYKVNISIFVIIYIVILFIHTTYIK